MKTSKITPWFTANARISVVYYYIFVTYRHGCILTANCCARLIFIAHWCKGQLYESKFAPLRLLIQGLVYGRLWHYSDLTARRNGCPCYWPCPCVNGIRFSGVTWVVQGFCRCWAVGTVTVRAASRWEVGGMDLHNLLFLVHHGAQEEPAALKK